MRKLVLAFAFCLVAALSTLALSAVEIPSAAPAAQEAALTPILPSPQPLPALPAFMVLAAPTPGCSASFLSTPRANLAGGCGECQKRSQCPACMPGCVKDCDGFGCCVCYCS